MENKETHFEWYRDFTLNALPKDQNGNVLYRGSSEEEYLSYVKWLGDYLYEVQLEPNREQHFICDFVRKCEPEAALEILAENAAFYDSDVECVKCGIELGEDADVTERLEFIDVERILKEESDLLEMCPGAEDEFCDVGWRTPLSAILKAVPQPDERVSLLRKFFIFYQEYSRK